MLLASAPGGISTGDIIFQLFSFFFLAAIVVGITSLFFIFRKRSKRLRRIEEKVDKLLADKEK